MLKKLLEHLLSLCVNLESQTDYLYDIMMIAETQEDTDRFVELAEKREDLMTSILALQQKIDVIPAPRKPDELAEIEKLNKQSQQIIRRAYQKDLDCINALQSNMDETAKLMKNANDSLKSVIAYNGEIDELFISGQNIDLTK